jgi:hypothetical protein
MNIDFIKLLQTDSVVSHGYYFRAVTNWRELTGVIVVIALVIYLIKRKRK